MEWINNNMNKMDIRTIAQRKRDELHRKVCGLFGKLREQNPGSSNYQIECAVSASTGLTRSGVRKILLRHGVITTKRQQEQ